MFQIVKILFQSTPSSRKVTDQQQELQQPHKFQSTPSSRKVTSPIYRYVARFENFNPHLPRGRWRNCAEDVPPLVNFNPHLPRGRWRSLLLPVLRDRSISIHTFLAEGDPVRPHSPSCHPHFNPHLPRGRWLLVQRFLHCAFNISIHTFLAEGDPQVWVRGARNGYFNPHLPRGRWQDWKGKWHLCYKDFNPHLPRGRWRGKARKTSI